MYQQIITPVAHSLGLSALVAAAPIVVLFTLLAVLRRSALLSAAGTLATAAVVALAAYRMPAPQVASGAAEGAVYGFFPVIWVAINTIWIFDLMTRTGHAAVLRRMFTRASADPYVQAVLLASCFGGILEAFSGGGAVAAIIAVMLIAVGFSPVRAAVAGLIADTAPVAFGSLALPVTVLSDTTGLPVHQLSQMIGRQTPVLGLVTPTLLVAILGGWIQVRRLWPFTLSTGFGFAIGQAIAANFLPPQVADAIAGATATAAALAWLRVRRAYRLRRGRDAADAAAPERVTMSRIAGAAVDDPVRIARLDRERRELDAPADVIRAMIPFLALFALVSITQVPVVATWADQVGNLKFGWPGLHVLTAAGKAPSAGTFKVNWLTTAGTLALLAGLLAAPAIGIRPREVIATYGATLRKMAVPIVTVSAIMAIAYVMNLSGQSATLGVAAARIGTAFAVVSPLIGWLGTALTGSDSSSNTMFGVLQVTTASQVGLPDVLTAAANSAGGVVGKAVSPQNLAVAAAAIGLAGQEGQLMRRTLAWTVPLLGLLCLLVYLQSTPLLSWMVPG